MARLYAGTSGFAYTTWRPGFYPDALPAGRFLAHYATRLPAVEINYTFSRLPSPKTVEGWLRATPEGFRFALKAPMRITHIRRLRAAEAATSEFFAAIEPLRAAGRLGPVLFQLPPNFKADRDLLNAYLEALPVGVRYAFEFRHPSWLSGETAETLRARGAALCAAEPEPAEAPQPHPAGFAYFRLRQPHYSAPQLRRIAARCHALAANGVDVYALFKHEETPEAALRAEALLRK